MTRTEKIIKYSKPAVWVLIISLLLYITIDLTRQRLPAETEVLGIIRDQSPVQTPVNLSSFDITESGFRYNVTPLFQYEVYGVVVSTYDSKSIFNFIIGRDSGNSKDLCLVWGKNIIHSIYAGLKYIQDDKNCVSNSAELTQNNNEVFDSGAFSDNRLIPNDTLTRSVISSMGAGDQVHLSGYLVDYSLYDTTSGKLLDNRKTSTANFEFNNISMKNIVVTKAEILRPWNRMGDYTENFLMSVIVLSAIAFLLRLVLPVTTGAKHGGASVG